MILFSKFTAAYAVKRLLTNFLTQRASAVVEHGEVRRALACVGLVRMVHI